MLVLFRNCNKLHLNFSLFTVDLHGNAEAQTVCADCLGVSAVGGLATSPWGLTTNTGNLATCTDVDSPPTPGTSPPARVWTHHQHWRTSPPARVGPHHQHWRASPWTCVADLYQVGNWGPLLTFSIQYPKRLPPQVVPKQRLEFITEFLSSLNRTEFICLLSIDPSHWKPRCGIRHRPNISTYELSLDSFEQFRDRSE
jgi:hypothetical protein